METVQSIDRIRNQQKSDFFQYICQRGKKLIKDEARQKGNSKQTAVASSTSTGGGGGGG